MKTDPNVAAMQRIRERLVKKFRGLDGWLDHLQAMDRVRDEARTRKQSQVAKRRSTHATSQSSIERKVNQ
jgi:hypothetical protein